MTTAPSQKRICAPAEQTGIQKQLSLDGAAQCKYHSRHLDLIADVLQLKSLLQLLFHDEVHRFQRNLPLIRNVLQLFCLIVLLR